MSKSPLTRTVTVLNEAGLHARPADLLVRMANQFKSTIMIGKGSEFVDCKSILSLLTLGAAKGTELSLRVEGVDADQALQSVAELFDSGFEDSKALKNAEPVVDSRDDN